MCTTDHCIHSKLSPQNGKQLDKYESSRSIHNVVVTGIMLTLLLDVCDSWYARAATFRCGGRESNQR